MVVLLVFMSILLKKWGMDENVSYFVQRKKFKKCVSLYNVQNEETEKVCSAVGGNLAVTGFGKYENKYCSFNAMSPFSS